MLVDPNDPFVKLFGEGPDDTELGKAIQSLKVGLDAMFANAKEQDDPIRTDALTDWIPMLQRGHERVIKAMQDLIARSVPGSEIDPNAGNAD